MLDTTTRDHLRPVRPRTAMRTLTESKTFVTCAQQHQDALPSQHRVAGNLRIPQSKAAGVLDRGCVGQDCFNQFSCALPW